MRGIRPMKLRQPTLDSANDTANETWRMWLLTGVRRQPVDRRRIRGSHVGLKRMLVEGMQVRIDRPYTWKEFSDAMVRQSVGEAMHSMAREDAHLVKLAYFGGLTNREIAGNLDLAEATVERRLRRALDIISRYIERGRGLGQRVLGAVAVWFSGRWLSDAVQHAAPAGAAAAVAAAILLVPSDAATSAVGPLHQQTAAPAATTTVVPPIPSPSVPVTRPNVVPETPSAVAPVAPLIPNLPPPPVEVPPVQLPPPHLPPVPKVPALPQVREIL
jgi:sigma-70-like protein